MNLVLLTETLSTDKPLCLDKRQSAHALKILKVSVGDKLLVGSLAGKIGHASVSDIKDQRVFINNIILDQESPKPTPLTLILALPRPQMIKRILQNAACMGLKKLFLVHADKVEKSFWQSPSLSEKAMEEQLILGLEQGKTTHMPVIEKRQRLKVFLEDEIAPQNKNTSLFIAHPGDYPACPLFSAEHTQSLGTQESVTIAIGPEGGFTDKEFMLFKKSGFKPVQLGPRILKVETAVTAILSRFI